jgi:carbonic anhydrase
VLPPALEPLFLVDPRVGVGVGDARSTRYAAAEHTPRPMRPAHTTLVLGCLDARTDPANFLGIGDGDALVLRNAGGRATPELTQQIGLLAAMSSMVAGPGATLELVLVHHRDCGMQRGSAPPARARVSAATGLPDQVLRALAIAAPEDSLTVDLAALDASPFVPAGLRVTALCYDPAIGVAETVHSGVTS